MWLIALKSLAGTSRLAVSPDRFVRQKCSDTPSPCVSPDPQGSCAVPFVSADRAAVATQSRCRDGQEPALVRRIGASIAPCRETYKSLSFYASVLSYIKDIEGYG